MKEYEALIVNEDFINRDDTYNIIAGGGGWSIKSNKGKVTVKDPRYLSGELVILSKGTIVVKDKNGNKTRVDKNDPRYLSGELQPIAKGKISVKDKDGNTFQIDKNDPRYLSGELVSVMQGRKRIIDKDGK